MAASAEDMTGRWKYEILKKGQVEKEYIVEFTPSGAGKYSGRYIVPQGNNSVFEAEVYPGRSGEPLILIRQLDAPYYSVICGLVTKGLVRATFRDNDGINKQVRLKR